MVSEKHCINSMTGSGQARFSYELSHVDIMAKSVNSRGLDVVIRLPKEMLFLETDFQSLATKIISRGRIEIGLVLVSGTLKLGEELVFCEKKASRLLDQLIDFSTKYPALKPEITLGQLFSMNNLFVETANNRYDSLKEIIKEKACEALYQALLELLRAREFEGAQLALVLRASIERCRELIDEIVARGEQDVQKRFEAISTRIRDLFSHIDLHVNTDRLMQECALLAERADFKEEIDRLIAHCEHFVKLCDDKAPKGRRLDFLCQEMLRESSTLLTKAFEHAVMASAIELKAEIERLREQVQNIE